MDKNQFNNLIQDIEIKGREERKKIRKSIIFIKTEVSLNKPAISQLKIKLGEELEQENPNLLKLIYEDCEKFVDLHFKSVNSKIELKNSEILVEAKETKFMYSLLDGILTFIKKDYEKKGFNIRIEGSWTKW